MLNEKTFYRYDGYDHLTVIEYTSVRETPGGYWLISKNVWYDEDTAPRRFVRKGAVGSWAQPSKKLARESYRRRKIRQIGHLKRQLARAEDGLAQATSGLFDEKAVYAL